MGRIRVRGVAGRSGDERRVDAGRAVREWRRRRRGDPLEGGGPRHAGWAAPVAAARAAARGRAVQCAVAGGGGEQAAPGKRAPSLSRGSSSSSSSSFVSGLRVAAWMLNAPVEWSIIAGDTNHSPRCATSTSKES
jgi:hypothetical protein